MSVSINGNSKAAIVVVGQTPPPFGGQHVMIQKMLDGDYETVRLHHVRMAFSREMSDIGRLQIGKLLELLKVIRGIISARVSTGATTLYYPPAGSYVVPVIRDIAILITTRWLFRRTILHFHPTGLVQLYERTPRILRPFFRMAYFRPDVVVRTTSLVPDVAGPLRASSEFIVPNGIEDEAIPVERDARNQPMTILHVGLLCERKGILVLLKACGELAKHSTDFRLRLVGTWESEEFRTEAEQLIRDSNLEPHVEYAGVRTGREKWIEFAKADVFCFPTHHPTETFSVALVEAHCAGIPVIATHWRASPEIIADRATGLLFEPHDASALAEALRQMVADKEQRLRMGAQARERYLQKFSIDKHRAAMDEVFRKAVG